MTFQNLRIGYGYDAHRLVSHRPLYIGCVNIPHETGLLGHSDADVLSHAIIDALLGAAGLKDIGTHFPDTDDTYKDISGEKLLKLTAKILSDNGYCIINIDSTIIAQAPKLAPYIDEMKEKIALFLNIPKDRVNVKAKTEEKMGFTGRKEGISSHAVCLLEKI